jgi:ABC-2 type transport system ATP-binding protein
MSSEIIRTENITKYFGNVCAVSDISLNVGKGEIYGFLGLNGAGKTTTIRMLLGMIRPSAGAAYINRKKVSGNNNELWNKVGSIVEVPYSYPELSVRENLEIIRRLRALDDKKAVDRIMEKLQLVQYSGRKARDLSLGNNQRLGLAKALMHNPEILILDEPANGLDPAGILEIRELLCTMAIYQGVTIFISSHILSEISRFATRIGIIHEGKLIQELDSVHLGKLLGKRLLVETKDNIKASSLLAKKGFHTVINEKNQLEINEEKALIHPEEIAVILVNSDCPPFLLKVEEEDLETYFLRIINKHVDTR